MIVLETAPDSIQSTNEVPLMLVSEPAEEPSWVQTRVLDRAYQVRAMALQSANPHWSVKFYQGRSGFCAVLSSGPVVIFVFPGGKVSLPDTIVNVASDPHFLPIVVPPKPTKMVLNAIPGQTVTDQAMILGAGLSTRFEPIAGDTTGYCKPAVPLLGNETVITAIAKHLKRHGFRRILVNTFFKPDSLKKAMAPLTELGLDIAYIDEQQPSGTAGGLGKAFEMGLVDKAKPILIVQGDAVTDCDFSFLLNTHAQRRALITIGGQVVPDDQVSHFGMIETDGTGSQYHPGDDQSGWIQSFKEKPTLAEAGRTRFANAGFYVLDSTVHDVFQSLYKQRYAETGHFDYAQDFFPLILGLIRDNMVDRGFWAQIVEGYWSDIGSPRQYLKTLADIYEGHVELASPASFEMCVANGVFYWPDAKPLLEPFSPELTPPVLVATLIDH